jgi:AmiR/NasT family two-component response regulator
VHAAIAIGRAQKEQQLNDALFSRKVIGQATGILMERCQIDEGPAFQFLTRASATGKITLVDVAHELVTTTDEGYRLRSQQ